MTHGDDVDATPLDVKAALRITAEEQLRQHFAGRRILVAEDYPVNQEIATQLLHAVGLVVDLADDGAEAVRLAKAAGEHGYDLILMDMQMPAHDGLDATREIRAELLSMPIIAMTASAFVEDRHACLDAGMDDHLAKPVDPAELYATLLRWLSAD